MNGRGVHSSPPPDRARAWRANWARHMEGDGRLTTQERQVRDLHRAADKADEKGDTGYAETLRTAATGLAAQPDPEKTAGE